MEICNVIKIEKNELDIDETMQKCSKQEIMDPISYLNHENHDKPQSMFIIFKTEDNARLVYKYLSTSNKEDAVPEEKLTQDVINFAFDEKLRMTPIVKLEKLDNSIIINKKRKITKKPITDDKVSSIKTFKIPSNKCRVSNRRKLKSFALDVNLQALKNCAGSSNCDKPIDMVPDCELKGRLSNINSKNYDLYPNSCNRTTTNLNANLKNNITLNLMKNDFEKLWEKQNEETLKHDSSQNSFYYLFSNSQETSKSTNNNNSGTLDNRNRIRRSLKKNSKSSNSNIIENNGRFPNISLSPGVDGTDFKQMHSIPKSTQKSESTKESVGKSNNNVFIKIKSPNNESDSFKKVSRKRKLNEIILPTKNLTKNQGSKKIMPPVVSDNKSKTIVEADILPKKIDSIKITINTEVTDEKLTQNTIRELSSDNAISLSSSKIFERRNSESTMSSESRSPNSMFCELRSPNSKQKVRLSRHTFLCYRKSLRKKMYTKSNIFTETLPRITSNHILFMNRSVLNESEIDLEHSPSIINESQKISKHKIVNEPQKTQVFSKENTVKRITDLRDIISAKPVVQDNKYVSCFEIKRPPTRSSSVSIDQNSSNNTCSSLSSSSSSSFLPSSNFQQRNLQLEDDVLSIFADSVIVNTSPASDRDFDDDDMEEYYPSFKKNSTYNIDEQTCNLSKSDVYNNHSKVNYLDNSLITNGNEFKNDNLKDSSENLFNGENSSINSTTDSKQNANNIKTVLQTETESSFVSSSSYAANGNDRISTSALCNAINLGFAISSSPLTDLSNSAKASESQDTTPVVINKQINTPFPQTTTLLNFKSKSLLSSNNTVKPSNDGSISPKTCLRSDENKTINKLPESNQIKNCLILSSSSPKANANSLTTLLQSNESNLRDNCSTSTDTLKSPLKMSDSGVTIVNAELCNEFRAFFRNVCFHYLEYGFCGTKHSLSHQIPSNYEKILQTFSASQISYTYNNFVCSYSFLLEKTIPTFAKYFGKYEDETNLFDMVNKLQNLKAIKPKVKVYCMSTILDALSDFMEYSVAIEKIFQNIAKKDISMIDVLLELILKKPSIENNWSLIKKLTSVEDYEIPLKVVEIILNDCCNRPKLRKFHLQKVYSDVITKIADVNLLKIKSLYIEDFVKAMEKLELNYVNEFKTRLEECKSRMNNISNDIIFKLPNIPTLQSVSSKLYITTTVNPNSVAKISSNKISNVSVSSDNAFSKSRNTYVEDRYGPTTSTNISNHKSYSPRFKINRQKKLHQISERQRNNDHTSITNVLRALRHGELLKGIEELLRYRDESDFNRIISEVVKQLSPETANYVMNNVYNNGSNNTDINKFSYGHSR